jgi:hypothetical protein
MKIWVEHGYYGCETGCCGHVIYYELSPGETHPDKSFSTFLGVNEYSSFTFDHPWSYGITEEQREKQVKEWAREIVTEEFGAEHVADLDWERCVIDSE